MDDFTVFAARYNKGKLVVRCPSPDGYKTLAARIIGDDLKCRFSYREGGYIASATKVEKFRRIIAGPTAAPAGAPL
ncbi:hypothetical protein [Ancylobacter amanitiformis]|uniref:Uncharacterized protein n=1 Tax=Ancylobacter amanitiformis TaxID=217069 RepID=A0ABU0LQB9_9HYPH|nr:hypothetical protein [Ancylobacter amanitiformis]MDQ0510908.1 hypothetical protein [Ancylobacter amanitiformis]